MKRDIHTKLRPQVPRFCIVVGGSVARLNGFMFMNNREIKVFLQRFPRHWVEV